MTASVRTFSLRKNKETGFSLVEILVVIAVIAILIAILFPVFAKVREKGRQSTTISNLHEIQSALAQYHQDHQSYPPVLFGYFVPGATMDNAYATVQAQARAANNPGLVAQAFPGLYPLYVRNKDVSIFKCPNNNADLGADTGPPLTVNTLSTAGVLTTDTKDFYKADAFDVSPQVTAAGTLGIQYIPRYQLSWTDASGTTVPVGVSAGDYTRQMRTPAPSGDTYVTCTTYHVPNADKVIVLYFDGSAKVIDTARFLPLDTATTIAPVSGVSQAQFWKITPNGH